MSFAKVPVIIESPYAGSTPVQVKMHEAYLRFCFFDSMLRNEAPFASHFIYTQLLEDVDPEDRELGITMGYTWANLAQAIIFYTDFGWSKGMIEAKKRFGENPTPIIFFRALQPAGVSLEAFQGFCSGLANTQWFPGQLNLVLRTVMLRLHNQDPFSRIPNLKAHLRRQPFDVLLSPNGWPRSWPPVAE